MCASDLGLPASVVSVAWAALYRARGFHHRSGHCPSSPESVLRCVTGSECEPCRDLFVDVVLHLRRVHRPGMSTAQLRRMVTNKLVSLLRAENHRRAGVSRPDRRDGVTGRIRTALADGPDSAWRDHLLTLLLASATARCAVPHEVLPFDALAREKTAATGRPVTVTEVRRDVTALLTVAADVAGPGWLDDNLYAALRFRRGEYTTLRLGLSPEDGGIGVDVMDSTGTGFHDPTTAWLTTAFWTELRVDGDPVPALARAARVCGATGSLPPSLLVRVALGYVADAAAADSAAAETAAAYAASRVRTPPSSGEVRRAAADRAGQDSAQRMPAAFVDDVVDLLAGSVSVVSAPSAA
ncbi:hypothetical protein [Pseudonocardia alni]|uniref:hypothetical protein n=1 Tax=Pseudonocardia alni TaxID=33907 RepID=UPI0033CBD3C2